jgi:hypothetical protein
MNSTTLSLSLQQERFEVDQIQHKRLTSSRKHPQSLCDSLVLLRRRTLGG